MNISKLNLQNINNYNTANSYANCKKYPNLSPLQYDTVSFSGLKKSAFNGVDAAVVEKYKAPIEKFNSIDDLNNWTNDKLNEIKEKDYKGRQEETCIQRKAMLNEWYDYVLYENGAYTPSTKLIILDSITKDLKADEDKLPPVLNKGVLADTVSELTKRLEENPKQFRSFSAAYNKKLADFYQNNNNLCNIDANGNDNKNITGWLIIPSFEHDRKNFDKNVEKLKTLSHDNWCTKSFNAEPYLQEGDFHIYLEDGAPKLGVRFIGDKIEEIQGEKNNNKIPLNYFDIAKKHIKEGKYSLTHKADYEIKMAKKLRPKADKIKKDLKDAIENNDAETIYNYFGIEAKKDENGNIILKNYAQLEGNFTFEDFEIDEQKLFGNVVEIEGDADFRNSKITSLENLKTIGGNAGLHRSKVADLGSLEYIGGDVDFGFSNITNLGILKEIGGNTNFSFSYVRDLCNLERIGKNANFSVTGIRTLGNLKEIGGRADFHASNLTNLGSLEYIGGDADFKRSDIKSLGKLKEIGGDVDFGRSKITDLGNLEYIGGKAFFDLGTIISSSSEFDKFDENSYIGLTMLTPKNFKRVFFAK